MLELKSLPAKVTLIGGGYIGMEFAGMFQRLGRDVHVVARQELPLAPRFDKEVGISWVVQMAGVEVGALPLCRLDCFIREGGGRSEEFA